MLDHKLLMRSGKGWSTAMLTGEESRPLPAQWFGLRELPCAHHHPAFIAAEGTTP